MKHGISQPFRWNIYKLAMCLNIWSVNETIIKLLLYEMSIYLHMLCLVMLYRIMSDVDCKLIDTIESYRLCPLDFKIIRNLLWHLILQPLFDFYSVKWLDFLQEKCSTPKLIFYLKLVQHNLHPCRFPSITLYLVWKITLYWKFL